MLDQATTKIRSVVVECRTWADGYGQAHSSATLWINNRYVAGFPLQYGDAVVLEEYTIAPYLRELRVISEHDIHRPLKNRVRATGADYYLIETRHEKKKDCLRGEHKLTPLELAEELAREEITRAQIWEN